MSNKLAAKNPKLNILAKLFKLYCCFSFWEDHTYYLYLLSNQIAKLNINIQLWNKDLFRRQAPACSSKISVNEKVLHPGGAGVWFSWNRRHLFVRGR